MTNFVFTRVGLKNFSYNSLLYLCWQKIFRTYSFPSAIPRKIAGDHRLDFLLPSFLSSRKEKKVGVGGQSPPISPARHRVRRKNSCPYFISSAVPEKITGSHSLDPLFPSPLSSRKEKKVGVRGQSPPINSARCRAAEKSFLLYPTLPLMR